MCFQELSAMWREYVTKMCLNTGWTTHSDETMNTLTAIRNSAVKDVIADSIYCFPLLVDRTNKHRGWRRALETKFVCRRSGQRMSVVNLHIISGTAQTDHASSKVPGCSKEARERFKSLALRNTLVQAHARLGAGVLIVAGDMNLKKDPVLACLSEFASQTNHTLVGMCPDRGGRDWIVSNVAAMESIYIDNVKPVDDKDHAVVAAKFTNALGLIVPIPRCIAGLADCMTTLLNSLKEHKREQAKLAEDEHRREEQNDPTTQVQGEVLPQLAIVTEQCMAPPTPVQPTAFDLRSPTSPADEDEGETHARQTLLELGRLRGAACVEEMTLVELTRWWRLSSGHGGCSAPLLPDELEVVQTQLAAARQPAPQENLGQAALPPLPALLLPASRPEETQPTSTPASQEDDLWRAALAVPPPLPFPQPPPMPQQAPAATSQRSPRSVEFDVTELRQPDRSREIGHSQEDPWRAVLPQPPPPPWRAVLPPPPVKAGPNAAPLMAAPRLEEPSDTSRRPAPPAAAPPAAEKAAPTPPKAPPGAPSATAAAAAATSQGCAPSTAAAAPAATSQRSSQSATFAASSAAAPAAAQGTKPRWGDVVDLSDDDDEVDGGGGSDAEREKHKFKPDGMPVVRLVTRRENGYTMVEASPGVEFDALEIVFRSERPLLRIAGLATFGRGEVRAGLVR